MTLIDKLKGTVDEAFEKSKTAVGENADKINAMIDRVTNTADERTGGKYTDRIAKLSETAKGGVNSVGGPTTGADAAGAGPVEELGPEYVPDPDVPDLGVLGER